MFTIGLKEGTSSDKWLFRSVRWRSNKADTIPIAL